MAVLFSIHVSYDFDVDDLTSTIRGLNSHTVAIELPNDYHPSFTTETNDET